MGIITFSSFFPSIWVCHIDKKNKINMNIQGCLYKFCKSKNISKVIRMDNDINYWNISERYNGESKEQMVVQELKKVYEYYCDKIKVIDKCYDDDVQLLIISHAKIELLYGLLVCFLVKYGDLQLDKSMMTIKHKLGTTIRISQKITKLLKYFKNENDKHK